MANNYRCASYEQKEGPGDHGLEGANGNVVGGMGERSQMQKGVGLLGAGE